MCVFPVAFACLLMYYWLLLSPSLSSSSCALGEKQTLRFALDHLANALSLLEAPASNEPCIKKEPPSDPPEDNCSGLPSSTVTIPTYDQHSKRQHQQQHMDTNVNSMAVGYGNQMAFEFMGLSTGMGQLPDSSIPSPLGMGLTPMQLSPNQMSTVLASIETPSPSSMAAYSADTSPSMPGYLNGLSPTLSPNFSFASSSVSSMLTSPISSPGLDRNGLINMHDSSGERTHPSQQMGLGLQMLSSSQSIRNQTDDLLRTNHLMNSSQLPRSCVSDLMNMKQGYEDHSNGLSLMGLPAGVGGSQFNLNEGGMPGSDHHTPLSKIIAGAMTDSMQI